VVHVELFLRRKVFRNEVSGCIRPGPQKVRETVKSADGGKTLFSTGHERSIIKRTLLLIEKPDHGQVA